VNLDSLFTSGNENATAGAVEEVELVEGNENVVAAEGEVLTEGSEKAMGVATGAEEKAKPLSGVEDAIGEAAANENSVEKEISKGSDEGAGADGKENPVPLELGEGDGEGKEKAAPVAASGTPKKSEVEGVGSVSTELLDGRMTTFGNANVVDGEVVGGEGKEKIGGGSANTWVRCLVALLSE